MLMSSGSHKKQRCSKSITILQTGHIYTGIPFTDVRAPCPNELSKQEKMCRNLLQGAREWLGAALKNELEQVRYGWGLERMLSQKLL